MAEADVRQQALSVRGRSLSAHRRQETIAAYVFLAPWLVGFTVFLAGPMLGGMALSLFKWNGIAALRWRGLSNYAKAFGDDDFWQSLRVTATFVFTALPLRVIAALALALLVNRIRRAQNLFSTIIYVPAVIPGVALALLFVRVLNPHAGLLNRALEWIGIQGPQWLFSELWALPGLMLMFLWQSGAAMILYIIGLESIPDELSEAASIDGAGPWRRFLRVTLPLLTPLILFNLIVGVIGNFQYFAPVYVMTQGGPNKATLFYVYNAYRTAFEFFELGYASAQTVILFVLISVMTWGLLRSSRGWVFYQGESR